MHPQSISQYVTTTHSNPYRLKYPEVVAQIRAERRKKAASGRGDPR